MLFMHFHTKIKIFSSDMLFKSLGRFQFLSLPEHDRWKKEGKEGKTSRLKQYCKKSQVLTELKLLPRQSAQFKYLNFIQVPLIT